MVVLGIGNVLQKDDGFGVYVATYLQKNYDFFNRVEVINGGVEGINLFNIFLENKNILILDTLYLNDNPGEIYKIPSYELSGHGLNSGGAHEIGVIQCLDMLELQGKEIPKCTILGIIPQEITFDIALTPILHRKFEGYLNVALNYIKNEGFDFRKKDKTTTLQEIIELAKDPSFSINSL